MSSSSRKRKWSVIQIVTVIFLAVLAFTVVSVGIVIVFTNEGIIKLSTDAKEEPILNTPLDAFCLIRKQPKVIVVSMGTESVIIGTPGPHTSIDTLPIDFMFTSTPNSSSVTSTPALSSTPFRDSCSAITIYPGPEEFQFYISNNSDFDIIFSYFKLVWCDEQFKLCDFPTKYPPKAVFLNDEQIECTWGGIFQGFSFFKNDNPSEFGYDCSQLISEETKRTIKSGNTKMLQLISDNPPDKYGYVVQLDFLVKTGDDTSFFEIMFTQYPPPAWTSVFPPFREILPHVDMDPPRELGVGCSPPLNLSTEERVNCGIQYYSVSSCYSSEKDNCQCDYNPDEVLIGGFIFSSNYVSYADNLLISKVSENTYEIYGYEVEEGEFPFSMGYPALLFDPFYFDTSFFTLFEEDEFPYYKVTIVFNSSGFTLYKEKKDRNCQLEMHYRIKHIKQ